MARKQAPATKANTLMDRLAKLCARTMAVLAGGLITCHAAGIGDFDGDGRDDLLLRHSETGAWIYYAIDGSPATLRHVAITPNLEYGFAGVGDFDGDGRDEVLLRHVRTGAWIYYAIDGSRVTLRRIGMTRNLAYVFAGVGDFDGDGSEEVLLRDEVLLPPAREEVLLRDEVLLPPAGAGDWIYYAIDGSRVTLRRIGMTRNLEYGFAGVGDFDGDRWDEVLLRHARTGAWIYYAIDGSRVTLRRIGMTRNLEYDVAGVGDFDGDRRDEVLLRHASQGAWIYYAVRGSRVALQRTDATGDRDYVSAGVGDFDGDGHGDVLLRDAATGAWAALALARAGATPEPIGGVRSDTDWQPPADTVVRLYGAIAYDHRRDAAGNCYYSWGFAHEGYRGGEQAEEVAVSRCLEAGGRRTNNVGGSCEWAGNIQMFGSGFRRPELRCAAAAIQVCNHGISVGRGTGSNIVRAKEAALRRCGPCNVAYALCVPKGP